MAEALAHQASAGLWHLEGRKLVLSFHSGQQRAWDSNKRFVLVVAGTQSGKTVFGPWWLVREIQRCGPGDYLAVSASFDLFRLKMLPELLRVFQELAILGPVEWRASDRVILLPSMGARIILRSAESGGGLESATAQAAWLDEAGQESFSLATWEAVLRRLSLSQGRVLITTTLYNLGWLTDIMDECDQGKRPDWDVVQFPSTVNPAFPHEEYERARREMAPWRFAMMYEGLKARPSGLIYSDYNPARHRIPPFPIPLGWRRYVGIDPGGANTAAVWLAESDDEEPVYYLYHELLTGDMSTPDLVAKITGFDELVSQYWGGAHSESQMRRDWTAAGRYVYEPPVQDVEAGIARVTRLLREDRLRVFADCELTHRQFQSYSRVLDASGQPEDRIANKETYHMLDALRYVVAGLRNRTPLPPPQHRPVYTRGH